MAKFLLLLDVGAADGVCLCQSGAAHLHLTTEQDVRIGVINESLAALEQAAWALTKGPEPLNFMDEELERRQNIADTEAMSVGRCDEVTDGVRCISKRGHFMAHDFMAHEFGEDEPSVPSVSS